MAVPSFAPELILRMVIKERGRTLTMSYFRAAGYCADGSSSPLTDSTDIHAATSAALLIVSSRGGSRAIVSLK